MHIYDVSNETKTGKRSNVAFKTIAMIDCLRSEKVNLKRKYLFHPCNISDDFQVCTMHRVGFSHNLRHLLHLSTLHHHRRSHIVQVLSFSASSSNIIL